MMLIERPIRRTVTPSLRDLDNIVDVEWRPIARYVTIWRAIIRSLRA